MLGLAGFERLHRRAAHQRSRPRFSFNNYSKEGRGKVLGASVSDIVLLISQDFLKFVAIAFIVACPFAYAALNQWLQGFAYRIELGLGIFAAAGLLALVCASATLSLQAIKAALTNPVEALRYE
jgi:putative ABC transport system permease protein